jgi:hypothetical protein
MGKHGVWSDPRETTMFFVRTTLVLGLGILLLPTDKESQTRVFYGAKTAVAWTVTFCDRNPATCVQGRQAWDVFVKKAEFGVRMAVDLINSRDDAKQPAAAPVVPALQRTPTQPRRSAGTLQTTDLEPAWRGKVAKASN